MNDNDDGERPQPAGNIDISRHTVSLPWDEVTASYDGTEPGVSMRWNKDGKPFGIAKNGKEITAVFEEEGIYSVEISAPGFQSKTGGVIVVLDDSVPYEKEGSFRFRKLWNVAVVMGRVGGKSEGNLVIPGTLGGLPVAGMENLNYD